MEALTQEDVPRCSACGNLYNEATGHRHSDKTVLCGVCAREFKTWWKGMTNRRWGKMKFYDFTESSRNKPPTEEV